MKKLIFACCLPLLASCGPKHLPHQGPPRIVPKLPMMSEVERYVSYTIILQGQGWPDTIGLEVYVDGEFISGTSGIWAAKGVPIVGRLYVQREWYTSKAYSPFGDPYEEFNPFPRGGMWMDRPNEEGPSVKIMFKLFEIEPHPVKPMKWKKIRLVARKTRTLKLSCWNCTY